MGSDPYLAPEVFENKKYDAVAVDIWSLAIIYCCMALRRFPWKIPRLSDNSYRLFAAEPTPGHDPEKMIHHHYHPKQSREEPSQSSAAATEDKGDGVPAAAAPGDEASGPSQTQAVVPASEKTPVPPQGGSSGPSTAKKDVIMGPWRLLRLLPKESRRIIYRMLIVDPRKRATMDEILADPWVAETIICRQAEDGRIELAEDHTHTLEPPGDAGGASQTPG